jgi:hypothetical protein
VSRAALRVASIAALLFVAGGASIPAASGAGSADLPECSEVLNDREARLVSGSDRVAMTDHTEDPGLLVCNWILTSGKTSFHLDLGLMWIDPKSRVGRRNLNYLGRVVCTLKGPAAGCDAREELLDASTATAAFRVFYRWFDDANMASAPHRVGSDRAFWLGSGKDRTDLYLLVAGGHAGALLHTACARVAKGTANVPFPACTLEAMRLARANFRGWWTTR